MTDLKVDNDWKDEAEASKEKLTEAESKKKGQAYVSCAEVALYLTELSNVLEQFTEGIRSSLKTMNERSERKGESDDGKD